jgi:hypothetical protein
LAWNPVSAPVVLHTFLKNPVGVVGVCTYYATYIQKMTEKHSQHPKGVLFQIRGKLNLDGWGSE